MRRKTWPARASERVPCVRRACVMRTMTYDKLGIVHVAATVGGTESRRRRRENERDAAQGPGGAEARGPHGPCI